MIALLLGVSQKEKGDWKFAVFFWHLGIAAGAPGAPCSDKQIAPGDRAGNASVFWLLTQAKFQGVKGAGARAPALGSVEQKYSIQQTGS